MSTAKLDIDINPQLPIPLVPVDIVYNGRRISRLGNKLSVIYVFKVNEEWPAQFRKKPVDLRLRAGDQLSSVTDAEGYVKWQLAVKVGRVPDREGAMLAVQERIAMSQRQPRQTKSKANDPIRNDLQRYRNLYMIAHNDEARAAVLASVIAAIVSP